MLLTKNHEKLLRDCYPKALTAPLAELKPDSNYTSKLTFYATGRPQKLPKVAAAILARAERAKSSADLAVTLDICKTVVSECRVELACFAVPALQVVQAGLAKDDLELDARSAALFHAVATFAGPLLSLDEAVMAQYQRCLVRFCAMAQSDRPMSRMTALKALEATVSSDLLLAAAANFEVQARQVLPALLHNCFKLAPEQLQTDVDFQPVALGPLDSRRSPSITVPVGSPDTLVLGHQALNSLRTIFFLSSTPRLFTLLKTTVDWLDRVPGNQGWLGEEWLEWLARSAVQWANVQHRASVVSWWSEQVMDIGDSAPAAGKATSLVRIVSSLLRGPLAIVGLGVRTILGHLTATLIRRAPLGAEDTLSPFILETIADLASKRYYFDMSSEMIGDLTEAMRKVRGGGGEGRNLHVDEQTWALRELVRGMSNVMEETKRAVPVEEALNGRPTLKQSETARAGELPAALRSDAERRHHISPATFAESLFLLTEVDATLRREYEQLLMLYIESELEVESASPVLVQSNGSIPAVVAPASTPLAKFLTELNTSIYELATCPSLGLLPGSSAALLRAASGHSARSNRRSSKSSRKSTGVHSLASAADYAMLRDTVVALQQLRSASVVLATVPMLLALDRDARTEWTEKNGDGEAGERVQACSEIAARGFTALGEVWGDLALERIGREALALLTPSVLPAPPLYSSSAFAATVDLKSKSMLDDSSIIDAVASSAAIQAASGLDHAGLQSVLSQRWTADAIRTRTTPQMIYRAAGSRSVTNLSRVRLASSAHSARSPPSTSLADLQISLGAHPNTSASTSIASVGTGLSENRRRSARVAVTSVLDGLGKGLRA